MSLVTSIIELILRSAQRKFKPQSQKLLKSSEKAMQQKCREASETKFKTETEISSETTVIKHTREHGFTPCIINEHTTMVGGSHWGTSACVLYVISNNRRTASQWQGFTHPTHACRQREISAMQTPLHLPLGSDSLHGLRHLFLCKLGIVSLGD